MFWATASVAIASNTPSGLHLSSNSCVSRSCSVPVTINTTLSIMWPYVQ